MLREVAVAYGRLAGQAPEEVYPQLVSSQLNRHIEPVEVARTIFFLLSDEAVIIRGQAVNAEAATRPIDGVCAVARTRHTESRLQGLLPLETGRS